MKTPKTVYSKREFLELREKQREQDEDGYVPSWYFKFRYDIHSEETPEELIRLLSRVAGVEVCPGTFGVEKYNKFGDVTKTHLHYHFVVPEIVGLTPQSLKDKMVYRLKEKYRFQRAKGWYGLTFEIDVRDRDRFFTYPLKQRDVVWDVENWVVLPHDFNLEEGLLLSSSEWKRNVEYLCAQREKKMRSETTYERILAKYEKEQPSLITRYECFIFIYKYFVSEGFPPDKTKIRPILDGLCLKIGLINLDQFYKDL